MARNGVKTGGRDWKKGQSGNPKGVAAQPEEIRKVKAIAASECRYWLYVTGTKSVDELKETIKNPNANATSVLFSSAFLVAIEYGNIKFVEFLCDRLLGKITDKTEQRVLNPTVVKLINENSDLYIGHKEKSEDMD